jgi:hypothetical protein
MTDIQCVCIMATIAMILSSNKKGLKAVLEILKTLKDLF